MDARDEILLQDLLDDRLDPATAEDVRGRIEAEPDLQEAWQELIRMRDLVRGDSAIRAPHDFLGRVRERIAVLPEDARERPDEASDLPLPSHPHWRWSTTVSAVAALLLVALGARLAFLGSSSEEIRVLESARVEHEEAETGAPAEWKGLETREADAIEPAPCEPVPEAVAEPVAGAAPAAPSGAPPRRGPADAVPPGLRAPSDEPAVRERRRDAKSVRHSRPKRASPDATCTIEAEALSEGRARLALVVAALRAGDAFEPLARQASAGREPTILGTVVIDLSPDEAARLVGVRPGFTGDEEDRGDRAGGRDAAKKRVRVHVQIVRRP